MYARHRRIISSHLPVLILTAAHAFAAPPDRITGTIDNNRRIELSGHVTPRIQGATDQGPVDASMDLPYVTLVLKPSAGQQAALDQYLNQLQAPSSPNYHAWLTPEQYADRFGISQSDIDKIVAWVGQRGLTVKYVARGRNAISFGGTAAQVESACGVRIHQYLVDGETHYANTANPTVPAALQGMIAAIRGLHNFRMKPRFKRSMGPRYNYEGVHYLGPDDIATIYNVTPLYSAGINGSGLKIAIVGQVQLVLSDISNYRSFYNLPANPPQVVEVPGSGAVESCNPSQPNSDACGDLGESDLDLELSGSVARNATLIFVYSADVTDAMAYVVDNAVAPVMSDSYGECEVETPQSDALALQSLAEQANSEGITWFAASGDEGAADCVGNGGGALDAKISVDLPAGLPQVTGVGGTEFAEAGGNYWSSQNSSTNSSALSYIPEIAWNDSVSDGGPAASGGGKSIYFAKPSWQTGSGVPSDGSRDVPDVALAASPDHDGYQIYTAGALAIIGGTSAGPPQFSGITTLLTQYLMKNGVISSPGLGNINPTLYSLQSVTGAFHDITSGNNIVLPCTENNGCNLAPIGYEAGVGYDLVTGLGSVNAYNLITAWHGGTSVSQGTVTTSVSASNSSLAFTGTTVLTATVTSSNGGTPTGTVTFSASLASGTFQLGTAALAASSGGSAVATFTLSGSQLAAGQNPISAVYSGDNNYDGGSATTSLQITSTPNGPPSITGMTNGASFTTAVAPGGILTIFGTQLAPVVAETPGLPLPTMLAGTVVTIDGIAAPLYYISPTQLNVQIPYEVPSGETATVRVINNGESVFGNLPVSAAAPAIFMFGNSNPVPFTTAAQGQVITLYFTGAGAVSPSVATGAAPAANTPVSELPAPTGRFSLTVGGVNAGIYFIGIPTWSVGVVQVDYTIPNNAPLGAQQVIASINGVASAPTTLTITAP